jgi:hypothetical protein
MPKRHGRGWTSQPPDLRMFSGKLLGEYLAELTWWLRQLVSHLAEPGSRVDRYLAVTSGTVTANAGVDGPLGEGSVVRRRINDDDTLEELDTVADVKSVVLTTIPTGTIVVVELIDGADVITSAVCPPGSGGT